MSLLGQYDILHERTANLLKANIFALAFFIPVILVPGLLFHWVWPEVSLLNSLILTLPDLLWVLPGLMFLVITHELIHGITNILLGGLQWGDIVYKIKWKHMAVITHIEKPMTVRAWRWGAAMPGIVQGILPLIVGLMIGSPIILIIGMTMTASAGGDLISLWLLRHDDPKAMVIDHPEKVGCCIINSEESH